MKQILQNPRDGALELTDVPSPALGPGQVLVRNCYSVLSPGTEKMALDFARKSILGKARSRPDLVKQVTKKLAQEGPLPTYRTVVNRLDAPQPLGYASAGIVEAVGVGVVGVSTGDRVACAGAGYANHAELIVVPENLVAHVPEGLSLDRAAFATIGAIALQGVRIGDPTLGEVAAVIGLGLIGQLTVQLLIANGCRVYGVDLDTQRVARALEFGMDWGASPGDDHERALAAPTGGHGVDFVLVTAASSSSAPVDLAARLCRQKGRIVSVGATAMDLDRRAFYEKELELRMSMSYGPGRYDRGYEEAGLDYPLPYVRWTEQRNLQAFLDLASRGAVDPLKMDVETVDFASAIDIYEGLARGNRKSLAAVFRYVDDVKAERTLAIEPAKPHREGGRGMGVAVIGAGNYAKAVLLPGLERVPNLARRLVVTSSGPSAQRTASRFGFEACGTDPESATNGKNVDFVFVATRHDSHASLAEAALRGGKGVWLEKPVGLSSQEVDRVARAAVETGGFLTVGYNRRFSSHARAVRQAFAERREAMAIQYVVSAGPTPVGTWITDPDIGGGRVIGELCHFIDLCVYLVGKPPVSVFSRALGRDPRLDDSIVSVLWFSDGSTASISYLANASVDLPKERWEVHADGRTAICENFRVSRLPGGGKVRGLNQDKGQATALEQELNAWSKGQSASLSLSEIVAVSRSTFAILESAANGVSVAIEPWHG